MAVPQLPSTPRTFLTALAAVGVLTLAACGDGESEEAAEAPEVPEVDVDEELGELVPDEIREEGLVTIGVEAEYPPGEYLDDTARPSSASTSISSPRP